MLKSLLSVLVIGIILGSCNPSTDVVFQKMTLFYSDSTLLGDGDSIQIIDAKTFADNSLDLKVLYHHIAVINQGNDTVNLFSPLRLQISDQVEQFVGQETYTYSLMLDQLIARTAVSKMTSNKLKIAVTPLIFEQYDYLNYPSFIGAVMNTEGEYKLQP